MSFSIILTGLLALAKLIIPSASDVTKVIFGDKSAQNNNNSEADKASQEAFGKEFSYPLGANRNMFDAFMDGINRLPRPMIVFCLLGLFVWTCRDPDAATKAYVALQRVPDMLWNISLLVCGFFFASRMMEKVTWKGYKAPLSTFVDDDGASVEAAPRRRRQSKQSDSLDEPAADAVPLPDAAPLVGVAPLVSSASDELLRLAGYGPGQLTRDGYTGRLPASRASGWKNPLALLYAVEEQA